MLRRESSQHAIEVDGLVPRPGRMELSNGQPAVTAMQKVPLKNRTRQNFGSGGAKQRLNSEAGRERDTTVTWARRGQMELFRVVPGSVDDSAKRARAEPVVDLAALLQATAASSGGCG